MKRIIAFLLLFGVGFGVKIGSVAPVLNYDGLEKVVFVTADKVEDEDLQIIQNGNLFYVSVLAEKAKEAQEKLSNIKGYCLYFNKETDSEAIIDRFVDFRASESEVGDSRVITGYNTRFADFRYVDGKKINVQIAFTQDAIIVGFPLILTGF